MRSTNIKSHITQDEKNFIDGLGSFGMFPGDREELLEGYLMAAQKRVNWVDVDAKEVIRYAYESLDKLVMEAEHAEI